MVKLLFTTFPVSTETFLQREVVALNELGFDFEIESLWGGEKNNKFKVARVYLFWIRLFTLFYWIPYWIIKKPKQLQFILSAYTEKAPPNLINFFESFLGFCFGLTEAKRMATEDVSHLHAVWASAPATAAWVISSLSNIPFSFGAHAYDLFENGGDWTLKAKIRAAKFVRTSTLSAQNELLRMGAEVDRLHVIRRGLNRLPVYQPKSEFYQPIRILSVGRLVEKMGYLEQIKIYAELREKGIEFQARILGGGPMFREIERLIIKKGLTNFVKLEGEVSYQEVEAGLEWADCFLFTGKVAQSGDRAGLPNAVAEAMAWGRTVFAFSVGAVDEVIIDGGTGWIIDLESGADVIGQVCSNATDQRRTVSAARNWIESNFIAKENMDRLVKLFEIDQK